MAGGCFSQRSGAMATHPGIPIPAIAFSSCVTVDTLVISSLGVLRQEAGWEDRRRSCTGVPHVKHPGQAGTQ